MNLVLILSLLGLFGFPVAQAQVRQPAHDIERQRAEVVVPVAPARAAVSAPATAVPAATLRQTASAPAPTAAPVPVAKPAAAVAPDFARTVELEIFKLINAERATQGLGALASDAKLEAIARAHSQDMLVNGYFSHTDQGGCDSSCRVSAAGYAWSATGENIYTMTGYALSAQETAQHMVEGWMNSPGHRANILNAVYTNHGIGVAISGGTIYATSEFATPQ